MVEYRVLSAFVSRRLNTDLKDFTFDLWKKRGTMKTVKISHFFIYTHHMEYSERQ